MWISEIFESIQGEGLYTGVPSLFVRTSGCNLRCWFCDTPETSWSPRGEHRDWEDVLAEVVHSPSPHVVLTGGEPLLQPGVVPLTRALRERGFVVTIETAGTVDAAVEADLMSISPKLSNSIPADHPGWASRHDARRDAPEVIRRWLSAHPYQLKFVVDQPSDVADVEVYLERFEEIDPSRVWLMPQGTNRDALSQRVGWIRQAANARGWRVSPRLHIELWGNRRGT